MSPKVVCRTAEVPVSRGLRSGLVWVVRLRGFSFWMSRVDLLMLEEEEVG